MFPQNQSASWSLNVMKCGHLFWVRKTNCISGWQLIEIPEKSLVVLWEIELVSLHVNYGLLCRAYIGNVLLLIQIFGRHTRRLSQAAVIELLAKKQDKQIILNGYVEQYHNLDRQSSNRWQLQICDRIDRKIALQSLNIELSMQEIYRRISFSSKWAWIKPLPSSMKDLDLTQYDTYLSTN